MDFLDFIHVLMLLAHASLGVRHAHLMASPLLAHASPHALLPTWCGITAVDGCGSGHLARHLAYGHAGRLLRAVQSFRKALSLNAHQAARDSTLYQLGCVLYTSLLNSFLSSSEKGRIPPSAPSGK